MKIITLNTWGGRIKKPLSDFLEKYKDADVFCFQEVFKGGLTKEAEDLTNVKDNNPHLYEDISKLLPNHEGVFCPVYLQSYGIAIFVKKDIKIIDKGEVFLHRNDSFVDSGEFEIDHSRKMQWVKIKTKSGAINIANVHGHWVKGDKKDNPVRLKQSQIIMDNLRKMSGPKILCGDFNLRPDTESVRMIEKEMTNLVTKYKVSTTRTNLYTKVEKFADYIFISPDIKEKNFTVLPDVVSDHSPLLIEI